MNFHWWQSLRFRIALVIFFLEAVMLSLVLSETQSYADENARRLIQEQDDIAIQLLLEESNRALLTLEYRRLEESFIRAASNPHILEATLVDERGLVVTSSNSERLGKAFSYEQTDQQTYLRQVEIESMADSIGELHLVFSGNELQDIYHETLQLGMSIGLLGMLIIALAGIGFGHLLTHKLQRLSKHAEKITEGTEVKPLTFKGRDEVSALAQSLNRMVTTLHSNVAKMRVMAYHDELTGLANRSRFHERLEQAVTNAKNNHTQHALLYVDLDQFKIVNDTCGHDAGDRLLAELSDKLNHTLRGRDTIARIGGDEFGILLEGVNPDQAALVAEKIRHTVADFRFAVDERIFQIGASIGVVMIDHNANTTKSLLSLADMACYAAKDRGRNTIEFATENHTELAERNEQMHWVPEIIAGIEEDRFEIHFQQISNTKAIEAVFGWEVLIRLRGRDNKLHFPSNFIAAAERFDLMPRLDRHICKTCCEAMARGELQASGDFTFINLSGQTLADKEFPGFFQGLLERLNLSPSQICFEITETAAINNLNHAIFFIEKLRNLGCKFALDDFGSGMCSFSYLKRLDVDFVKIDGGFIEKMLENPLDESIVRAIVDIAESARFKTLAEFVEQSEQLERLKTLGVDLVQGHLIHRPEPLFDTSAPNVCVETK